MTIRFKSTVQRSLAVAALAFLASGGANAAKLGQVLVEVNVPVSTPNTRAEARSKTWGAGWNACRAKYSKTRSIWILTWGPQIGNNVKTFVVYWGCSDSTTAPPDGGVVSY